MSAVLHPLAPADVRARLAAGTAVLVDIREADEFARSHVAGALSRPLSSYEQANLKMVAGKDVVFTCRSGMRTGANCARLSARIAGDAYVLDGGLDNWVKASAPLYDSFVSDMDSKGLPGKQMVQDARDLLAKYRVAK